MDIELTPEKMDAARIDAAAQKAAQGKGIDSGVALALLRHVLWQDEEMERLRVRLDPYLDRAHGSPAVSLH